MVLATVLAFAATLLWFTPVRVTLPRSRRLRPERPASTTLDVWSVLVESIATGVRSGAAPTLACAAACSAVGQSMTEPLPQIGRLHAAAVSGGDLAAAWRDAADSLDDPGLWAVASAWALSDSTGAPLADALAVASRLRRSETERAARAKSALAAPVTSVNLLTGLPICGAGLGGLLGVDVWSVYASPLAVVTVVPGVVLIVAGRWWCRRLVARAGRTRRLT
ncbi:hypothetical protein [Yimella sp. NH-Cas1]|uniref:hypothetical protein n=1 Tax=Yimella sp. NH-Cas1 TaxID=2917726 RepID=UPI001EFAF1EC|nr:hypothetical protein [Yimella sp. NH-Cas1]MCG8656400.1 hypothetical protein [Yimella sp. NH-Cas1]